MKILKLGMLICGALGLAGLIARGIGRIEVLMEVDAPMTIVVFLAFALPVVMAVIGLAKPPLRSWQAGVSLAGFALAAWKLEVWKLVNDDAAVPVAYQLMRVGAGLGVILTVIAVMKPEEVRPIA